MKPLSEQRPMPRRKAPLLSEGAVVTGTVGRNVEINNDEMNFVASDELNPQKARILLMLALLKPRSLAEIQNLSYSY
jgi:L-asparaginase